MARFNTSGLDDVLADMKRLGELTGPTADKMLMAGAEQTKQAWRKSAEMHGHRDTGEMIESIGYASKPTKAGDIKKIDIYPQGKTAHGKYRVMRRSGRRDKKAQPLTNAGVAFVLHYGTSSMPGSHWVDDADEMAAPLVTQAMTEIWDDHLKGK